MDFYLCRLFEWIMLGNKLKMCKKANIPNEQAEEKKKSSVAASEASRLSHNEYFSWLNTFAKALIWSWLSVKSTELSPQPKHINAHVNWSIFIENWRKIQLIQFNHPFAWLLSNKYTHTHKKRHAKRKDETSKKEKDIPNLSFTFSSAPKFQKYTFRHSIFQAFLFHSRCVFFPVFSPFLNRTMMWIHYISYIYRGKLFHSIIGKSI